MNPLLFPDDALDILAQAHHDPNAERGYNAESAAFLWTDERLHLTRATCERLGSRAEVHLLRYRTSLIRGEPVEEYRAPWDQLQAACPDWPGFRPERQAPALARALDREQFLRRLLPGPSVTIVAYLIGFLLLPFFFALPFGVQGTALSFRDAPESVAFWVFLAVLAVGLVFQEGLCWVWRRFGHVGEGWHTPDGRVTTTRAQLVWPALSALLMQFLTVFLFAMVMDGGVRFRVCLHAYALYVALALPLLVLRWRRWTWPEAVLLRWGWAPVLAFGMPLLYPLLTAWGWVWIIS
jgi:hypothetical protein